MIIARVYISVLRKLARFLAEYVFPFIYRKKNIFSFAVW